MAARVTTSARSLRRLRVSGSLVRWVVIAAAAAGLAASARYAIAPPHPAPHPAPAVAAPDLAAEGFAADVTRRYLTFDGDRPQRHRAALSAVAGADLDPDLGLRAPPGRAQRVSWTQVVGSRPAPDASRVYTVAAQTDRAGLLYLSVDVARDAGRGLRLRPDGYPALVGAPFSAAGEAPSGEGLRGVDDQALGAMCRRALRNYLARAADNLDADLTADAVVALPGLRLGLRSLSELVWAPGGRSVLATVQASDADDVTYALRYELDVRRLDGRWAIAAIQTDPTA